MKCAATLTVERNKVHVGSFCFFVKKKKKKQMDNNIKKNQQNKTTKKPIPSSPPHHPPSTLRILSLVRFQLQGLGFCRAQFEIK